MEALRLVSEGRENRAGDLPNESSTTREVDRELTQCLSSIVLPSREVLLTLSWALKVEVLKIEKRQRESGDMAFVLGPENHVLVDKYNKPTEEYNLKIVRRKRGLEDASASAKRHRLA